MYASNFVYSGLLVKHGRGWRTRDQSWHQCFRGGDSKLNRLHCNYLCKANKIARRSLWMLVTQWIDQSWFSVSIFRMSVIQLFVRWQYVQCMVYSSWMRVTTWSATSCCEDLLRCEPSTYIWSFTAGMLIVLASGTRYFKCWRIPWDKRTYRSLEAIELWSWYSKMKMFWNGWICWIVVMNLSTRWSARLMDLSWSAPACWEDDIDHASDWPIHNTIETGWCLPRAPTSDLRRVTFSQLMLRVYKGKG